MGSRGGSGQELYRKIAAKGREAAKERPAASMGDGREKLNLQREAEQRMVAKGAVASKPTSSRGKTRVS